MVWDREKSMGVVILECWKSQEVLVFCECMQSPATEWAPLLFLPLSIKMCHHGACVLDFLFFRLTEEESDMDNYPKP